jgi:hypothetical protein
MAVSLGVGAEPEPFLFTGVEDEEAHATTNASAAMRSMPEEYTLS